jgi:hypothetical protein
MGATHFRLRTLEKVRTEMSLHVLAYNLKRMVAILGVQPMIQAIRAASKPVNIETQTESQLVALLRRIPPAAAACSRVERG